MHYFAVAHTKHKVQMAADLLPTTCLETERSTHAGNASCVLLLSLKPKGSGEIEFWSDTKTNNFSVTFLVYIFG